MAAQPATLDSLSRAFEGSVDGMASVIATRARDEIAEVRDFDAPQFWEAVREVTRGSRCMQAHHLRRWREVPTACPAPDADGARLAARMGVSCAAALKSYRIAHAVAWDGWLDAIEGAELDAPSRKACVRAVSRFVDEYDNRLMEFFAAEYERARMRERPGGRRLALICDVLEGMTDDASELEYDLRLEHVAAIAWGRGASASLRRLAGALDRRLLCAEVWHGLHWAWLGSGRPLDREARVELARFEPAEGSAVCIGNAERGPSGFRRSHRQAGDAYLVAIRRPRPVTMYADVALEALVLRDERVARDYATFQLRNLDDDERLRVTLRRYFASSQNAAATAAALGVHEQTVARRLKAVEARLGHPVNQRRAELELALRLEELLADPPPS